MKGLEGGCVGCFCGMIARNGDIDDTSGRNVIREKDGGELDLDLIFISIAFKVCNPLVVIICESRYGKHWRIGGALFPMRPRGSWRSTHQAIILGEKNGDTRIYLADSQGDEHGG